MIVQGTVFNLLIPNASSTTQMMLANKSFVTLQCAMNDGSSVALPVYVVSVLTGSLFQVNCTVTQTTTYTKWANASQFF